MNQKKTTISIAKMFMIFLKIASFTFGGGYTIVPVMKDEFSVKRKLIDEKEMLDIVSISTSGPGPMAINCAIITGYRLHGVFGAIMAAISSAIPSLVIITIISYFYKEFSENYYVKAALTGMGGAIAGVLLITSYDMAKQALKTHTFVSAFIIICTFVASYVVSVNTGIIILVTAIFGLFVYSLIKDEEKSKGVR
ncbi:chromate transporter, partial [Helcococcus ovis]|uniref:chromate transporter n=1 Tax=Helcococcus ovis TaxID=72026 RepID=UPI00106F2B92|nr:chromate transporter [Helcococcus ovis]TFF68030.1 chromate transporter [Helcococcus ovis]WNZ01109.1 chromate transporter [Helcococcus ovis]